MGALCRGKEVSASEFTGSVLAREVPRRVDAGDRLGSFPNDEDREHVSLESFRTIRSSL
jgi:hypothetical protein